MFLRISFPFLLSLVAQLFAGLTPTHAAGRPCVDNFSQSGQQFETFIEVKGDSTKALTALARKIAAQGFLGMTVSKDVGIVAAYQETNGKKSSLTATVSQLKGDTLKVEASFVMAAGLRATKAGALGAMCDILEATLPADERNRLASDTSGSVLLKSAGTELRLDVKVGTHRIANYLLAFMAYMDFPGATAGERTKDPKPVLSVPTNDDPAKSYFLVKLESDKDREGLRSLKIGSAITMAQGFTTGKFKMDPDGDWTLPFSTRLEGEGRWSITPLQNLEPGEYGLYDAENGGLSAFGVDRVL